MNLVVNKTAFLGYSVLDSFEAGIKLSGAEVKSLRGKLGSLKEAYIKFAKDGTLLLTNAYIPPYQAGHKEYESYNPSQDRELLLKKRELTELKNEIKNKGLTIIPIRIFAKKRFIKIEIALAKGKKQHDKREDLKKKAVERDLQRELREK